jgi:putative ABC transport system substrate-binding protein
MVSAAVGNAQPAAKAPVVGLLDAGKRLEWWAALKDELRGLGYVEGRNIAFEARYAEGQTERLPTLAGELIRLKPAVIVTGARAATQAAAKATTTIPIVTATGDSPVAAGLAASFARPGGNITGVTSIAEQLTGKRLEMLKEVMPRLTRLGVLWHAGNPASETQATEAETAARAMKIDVQRLAIMRADDLPRAFATATHERVQAVLVIGGPMFYTERERIGALALKHRLPTMHSVSEYVDAGGLISYGPSYAGLFRRAALYVDKILKGAKPGDLPIEQPTQISMIVNLKTARALSVTVPQPILLRAERVIE